MPSMTTEEAVKKVTKWLILQDHETVCLILAALMLDIYRFSKIDELDTDELDSLLKRTKDNADEFTSFLGMENPTHKLEFTKC